MKKRRAGIALGWIVRLLVVLSVVAMYFLPPFAGTQQSTDTAVIKHYDALMDIDRSGALNLTETLDVEMPAGKHGIFRIFDTRDPRRRGVDHPVTVESVTRDGEPETYVKVDSRSGTYSIRIGKAYETLTPGVHQYVIKSRTTDVFEPGEGDTTLWWWDVVGAGWQMSMDSATVTAHLPATPTKAECVQGKDTPCEVSVLERTMTVNTGALAPFEPVTVRLSFPAAALPAPHTGTSPALTIVLSVIAGLISGSIALLLVSRTHEKPVGLPVLFEPPQGIYPALGSKILDEVNSPYALQATLFDLAERGLLTLHGHDKGWDIDVVGEPSQTVMTEAEAGVLGTLGLSYKGARFKLRRTESAGELVSDAQRDLNAQVSVDSKPYLSYSLVGLVGTALAWLALFATGFQVVDYFSGGLGPYWPPLIFTAVFALIGAELLFNPPAWTVRNAAGRELWSRVGGFARFLTTDSAETRFDFAQRMDLYPRYLPWALVLGSADAWAQRYRDQGVEPPTVPWLVWTGSSRDYSLTSMTNSFNSSITSAAAAYAASQSSSGGGGFSGGSGGGGGGGGSW